MKRRNRQTRRANRKFIAPRTIEEFLSLSDRDQERWVRLTHVPSIMRTENVSFTKAAEEAGLNPRAALRLGRSGFSKRHGRYKPKRSDGLLRPLVIPTAEGTSLIGVGDLRQAVLLADYWNAVQKYLETGDASALEKFRGKHVTDVVGRQIQLITNLDELNRLGNAGSLSFESLYARSA